MQMIITRVAAMTMRVTSLARPGYGVSSPFRKSHNHEADGPGCRRLCARDATLNVLESQLPTIRSRETIQAEGSSREHEPETGWPDGPSSGFSARPEGQWTENQPRLHWELRRSRCSPPRLKSAHLVWRGRRRRLAFRGGCAAIGLHGSWRPPTRCARQSG